jgi:hypothetical protein
VQTPRWLGGDLEAKSGVQSWFSLVFTLQRLSVPESLFPSCYSRTPWWHLRVVMLRCCLFLCVLLRWLAGRGVKRKMKRKEKVEKRKDRKIQKKERERKKLGEKKKWII